jgi:hypothetical protein
MKNVTITLPEELARRARVEAAKVGKSLSRYVADMLAKNCPTDGPSHAEALAKLEEFLSGPGYPGISKAWKGRDALHAEREDELLRRYDASRLRNRPGKSAETARGRGFAEDGRDRRYAGAKRTKPK